MDENGFDKEAQEILEAPHAAAAKVISNRIPPEQLKNWADDKKLRIMNSILRAKVNQCPELKRALTAGGKNNFCEATRDLFWGCGMNPELARYTKPCAFKGRNELGKLLNEIASDIGTQYLTKSQNQLLTALNTSNTTMTTSIMKAVPLLSYLQPPTTSTNQNGAAPATTPYYKDSAMGDIISSPFMTPLLTLKDIISPPSAASSCDHQASLKKREPSPSPSSSPSPTVFPLIISAQCTPSRTRRSKASHEYPDRPQSPLVGKMARRLLKPRRIQNPPTTDTEDSDSDMNSVWPNWDRDSIASEIRCVEDCYGPVC